MRTDVLAAFWEAADQLGLRREAERLIEKMEFSIRGARTSSLELEDALNQESWGPAPDQQHYWVARCYRPSDVEPVRAHVGWLFRHASEDGYLTAEAQCRVKDSMIKAIWGITLCLLCGTFSLFALNQTIVCRNDLGLTSHCSGQFRFSVGLCQRDRVQSTSFEWDDEHTFTYRPDKNYC